MALACPVCGSRKIRKKVLGSGEHDLVKYLEVKLVCRVCGHSEVRKVARRLQKRRYISKKMRSIDVASSTSIDEQGSFKSHLPSLRRKWVDREDVTKAFELLKRSLLYASAISLGVLIEYGGFELEKKMMAMELPAFIGFTISLIFFIFAPILIVGSIVYYLTKDLMRGVVLGALAIPVTLIIIYYSRRLPWKYLGQVKAIYDMLLR
ncbi:MAG: hypothetical protein ACE5PM_02185 [Candidatus Hydrothermarchaeales archaeon]